MLGYVPGEGTMSIILPAALFVLPLCPNKLIGGVAKLI